MNDVPAERVLEGLRPMYEVERELPPGGMSRVFLARDVALDRLVVVKILLGQLATPSAVDRFQREILLAAGLHHPNIVGVLSAGDVDGMPYYVMPFIEGASLADRLAATGRLSADETTSILRDIARALAYAHERGIIHRDVKPRNVLLVSGAAMVADFGVAKALRDAVQGGSGERALGESVVEAVDRTPNRTPARVRARTPRRSEEPITATGLSIGTPLYMAPEQAAGDPSVDHHADIYALGVTAYEMLTGQPPFADMTPHALLRAKLTTAPPSVDTVRPDVPPSLAALVQRCLAPLPADRPPSADAVVDALRSGGVSTAWGVSSVLRSRWRRVAAATLIVAAVAAGVWKLPMRSAAMANRVASPTTPVAPASTTLAVLVVPVVALSEDSSDAHLAEGLTAHVAAMLSRVPAIRVISPSHALSLMREGSDAADVARKLGASRFVEGTIGRSHGQLRTTARVVDVTSGTMLWGESFEHGASELFELQDDVAAGVAEAIRPGASAALAQSPTTAARAPAPTEAAYELVLRGRYLLRTRHPRAMGDAIEAFARAQRLAPGYAPAASGLAEAYMLRPLYEGGSALASLDRAARAADRALLLDSMAGDAHLVSARVADAQWRWDDAERSYRRAIALSPLDAGVWQAYGEHLLVRADAAGAIRALDRAVSLDSNAAITRASLAIALAAGGNDARARVEATRAVQDDPALPAAWSLLGAVHLFAGRAKDGASALDAGLALDSSSVLALGLAGYAAARNGDAPLAERLAKRLNGMHRVAGQSIALAHVRLGQRDTSGALAAIERAVAEHDPYLVTEPLWSPLFDVVRESARFRRALATIGLMVPARTGPST